MANPQTEDGFTRFANELLEAFCRTRIAGQEYQVVLSIARLTYGFGKKTDHISYGQLSKLTGISRPKLVPMLRNLQSRGILAVTNNGNRGVTNNGNRQPLVIGINKNFDEWVLLPKKGTVPNNGNRGVTNNGNKSVPNNGTYQRKKEKIKKESVPEAVALDDFETLWQHYPGRGVPPKKTGKDKALKAYRTALKDKSFPGISVLLVTLDQEKQSKQWGDSQYIPMAATWLNRKPWKDESSSDVGHSGSILDTINSDEWRPKGYAD